MNKNNTAVLQFIGYRVTDITYKCKPNYEFPEGNNSFQFSFSKSTSLLSQTIIQENLGVNIYFSEEESQNIEDSPYQLAIELSGRFAIKEEWCPKWETNVLSILFPYLRSLVSTITCNSGREPIILPTINIANIFSKD